MSEVDLPTRGRPRDAAREAEILEATLELIADVGYDRVSMDAVAAACNASKATLYRRWPSKAAMVVAALHCRAQPETEAIDTGDVRADLIAGMSDLTASFSGEDIGLLVGMLNAIRADAELAREFRARVTVDKRAAAQEWTERAIERGVVRPDADLALMHQIGPALLFFRLLVTGDPVGEDFCRQLVDDVLLPLIAHNAPAGPVADSTATPASTSASTPQPRSPTTLDSTPEPHADTPERASS